MAYSTAVTLAIAKVLMTLARHLRPLGSAEKLQVLKHVVDAAQGLGADIRVTGETKDR